MCGVFLLKLFLFSIILKSTFSNVSEVSSFTTNSEFETYKSTTEFEVNNSTSDQFTTVQAVGQRSLFVNKSFVRPKCNVSSDCPDSQMLCTVNNNCRCPTFYSWNAIKKGCIVNFTDLHLWFQHSINNDSETVSQTAEFDVDESGPFKILTAKWTNFPRSEKEEVGQHIYGVIWPMMLGFFIIAVLYAAIVLNYM